VDEKLIWLYISVIEIHLVEYNENISLKQKGASVPAKLKTIILQPFLGQGLP
jgi:hypothetical protein